jgi:cystathionine gamma-lyase
MGIDVQFVDFTNLKKLEAAITPNVKLVWMETPTNPLVAVIDIRSVAEIVCTKTKGFLVVDNTFLSAYFQRPLDLGADIVMYSLTKFMNGHTDVVMGSAATNNDEIYEQLNFNQRATG